MAPKEAKRETSISVLAIKQRPKPARSSGTVFAREYGTGELGLQGRVVALIGCPSG
jgi:hypothetical protein